MRRNGMLEVLFSGGMKIETAADVMLIEGGWDCQHAARGEGLDAGRVKLEVGTRSSAG